MEIYVNVYEYTIQYQHHGILSLLIRRDIIPNLIIIPRAKREECGNENRNSAARKDLGSAQGFSRCARI